MTPMIRLSFFVAISLWGSSALAIERYNSTTLACENVRQILRDQGAAVLRYPSKRVPGMALYDRYVRNTNSCSPGEYAERATVPTRDNPACPVLNCKPVENLQDGFIRFVPHYSL
ncbi:hypothetical protein RvVAR0630_26190 [Agrobacterium vitis]|uniref:hypothetical protein n=1 Tax=Agrobacterium vitis TaxID=373 RepID=UPI0015DD4876|nr:hypothetical protein [Agrobacterium vitis]BCH59995.1 hypothetical protein RvVAR0630_26190 [Agrobacterium vitis]